MGVRRSPTKKVGVRRVSAFPLDLSTAGTSEEGEGPHRAVVPLIMTIIEPSSSETTEELMNYPVLAAVRFCMPHPSKYKTQIILMTFTRGGMKYCLQLKCFIILVLIYSRRTT